MADHQTPPAKEAWVFDALKKAEAIKARPNESADQRAEEIEAVREKVDQSPELGALMRHTAELRAELGKDVSHRCNQQTLNSGHQMLVDTRDRYADLAGVIFGPTGTPLEILTPAGPKGAERAVNTAMAHLGRTLALIGAGEQKEDCMQYAKDHDGAMPPPDTTPPRTHSSGRSRRTP
jgi:hypothetical protein